MRKAILLAVLLLPATAVTARAQWGPQWGPGPPPRPVPNLNGVWYLNDNPDAVCQVVQQRPDGRALFINEKGSRAWGTVRGDDVWIPDWSDGYHDGLRGVIRRAATTSMPPAEIAPLRLPVTRPSTSLT